MNLSAYSKFLSDCEASGYTYIGSAHPFFEGCWLFHPHKEYTSVLRISELPVDNRIMIEFFTANHDQLTDTEETFFDNLLLTINSFFCISYHYINNRIGTLNGAVLKIDPTISGTTEFDEHLHDYLQERYEGKDCKFFSFLLWLMDVCE